MGTPRSEKGFTEAIEAVDTQLAEIEQKMLDVEPDSDEESDLIQSKADLGVERAELEEKFEAFKNKQSSEPEEGSDETPADDEEGSDETPADGDQDLPEIAEEKPAEKVWPKTVEVRAKSNVGFMVNPFNHTRITEDWKEVITDNWTINQIEAGLLEHREA